MKGSRLSMGSSVAAVSIGLKLCHSRGIQRNLGRVSGRQVWFKRDKEPSISSTSWMTISLTSPKPALWLTMECYSRGPQLMATKQAIKKLVKSLPSIDRPFLVPSKLVNRNRTVFTRHYSFSHNTGEGHLPISNLQPHRSQATPLQTARPSIQLNKRR